MPPCIFSPTLVSEKAPSPARRSATQSTLIVLLLRQVGEPEPAVRECIPHHASPTSLPRSRCQHSKTPPNSLLSSTHPSAERVRRCPSKVFNYKLQRITIMAQCNGSHAKQGRTPASLARSECSELPGQVPFVAATSRQLGVHRRRHLCARPRREHWDRHKTLEPAFGPPLHASRLTAEIAFHSHLNCIDAHPYVGMQCLERRPSQGGPQTREYC